MDGIPGREVNGKMLKHTNVMKGEMGMLLRALRGVPVTPALWSFCGGRCSGYSALPQASGFVAGHLFSSVLTFIGLGNSWQVSGEVGEEILLCL